MTEEAAQTAQMALATSSFGPVPMTFKMNYAGASNTGFKGTMEHGARRFQSDRVSERFTPYPNTGSYGVTFMRPTDSSGVPLAKRNKDYEYIHNGRGYKLNSDGVIRLLSPEAFNPTKVISKKNIIYPNFLHT